MTRETKAGLVVSCSFLCLVGIVLFFKLQEKDHSSPSADAAKSAEQAEVPAEPKPVEESQAGQNTDRAGADKAPPPAGDSSTAGAAGVVPARFPLDEHAGSNSAPKPKDPEVPVPTSSAAANQPLPAPELASTPSSSAGSDPLPRDEKSLAPKPDKGLPALGSLDSKVPATAGLGGTSSSKGSVSPPFDPVIPLPDSSKSAGSTGAAPLLTTTPALPAIQSKEGPRSPDAARDLTKSTPDVGAFPSRPAGGKPSSDSKPTYQLPDPPRLNSMAAPAPTGPGTEASKTGGDKVKAPTSSAPDSPLGLGANLTSPTAALGAPAVNQDSATGSRLTMDSPPLGGPRGAGVPSVGATPVRPLGAPQERAESTAKGVRLATPAISVPVVGQLAQGPDAALGTASAGSLAQPSAPLGTPAKAVPAPSVVETVPPSGDGTPQVESYDEETYTCRPNDSFRAVSQMFYRTEKYERALLLFNRNHPLATEVVRQEPPVLQPGQPIYIPPARILEKYYAVAIADRPALAKPGATAVIPAASVQPKTAATEKVYRVGANGEMVLDIARRTLGNENRWPEIYRLNPRFDPRDPVPAGTDLRLPADARVQLGETP